MSPRPPLPPEADANQARASDPSASAWVSASAGTGKTEVLVRRVLRLLLAGFKPESILCLTYTKTAAAEMQNRLCASLPSGRRSRTDVLAKNSPNLTRSEPDAETLRIARRLFARALEAKGGLKIHTIHGFCETAAAAFPARSAGHAAFLRARRARAGKHAARRFRRHARPRRRGKRGRRSARLSPRSWRFTSGEYLRQVIDTVMAKRAELARMVDYHAEPRGLGRGRRLGAQAPVRCGRGAEEALLAQLAGVLDETRSMLPSRPSLAFGSTAGTDKEAEASLRRGTSERGREPRCGAGGRCSSTTGRKAPKPDLHQGFRQDGARASRRALSARKPPSPASMTSSRICAWRRRAPRCLPSPTPCGPSTSGESGPEVALDYDDLIVKTQNLLSRADAASWVLYKIDGGDRPHPGRRGAGHQSRAMDHHREPGGGVLRRRGQKRQAPHAVRRRRREAVDLQLPGREPGAVRRGRPRLPAKGQGAFARLAQGAAHPLLPLDRADPQGRRSRFRPCASDQRT